MAVIKMNFLSKYLGMQTNVTVCIPSFSFRDFIEQKPDFYRPGIKFQTLYLLHGGAGDDSDYVNLTSIVRYADENKVAVVMPCDYNRFYTDDPHGPRYWKYVAQELPALCQAYFPLSAKREDNFVAGLSMGGAGAMKMGILEGERFAAVLCMSGAAIHPDKVLEFGRHRFSPGPGDPDLMPMISLEKIFGDLAQFKGGPHDVYHQARLNVEQGRRLPKFFFTVGDQDFAREGVEDAAGYLKSLGYETFFELVPGYGHEWSFWDLTLKKALESWLPLRREATSNSDGSPPNNRLAVEIEAGWAKLEASLAGLDEQLLAQICDEGGWSIKDHLAHIAAWDDVLLEQFLGIPFQEAVQIAGGKSPRFDDLNEDFRRQWAGYSTQAILNRLRGVHQQLAAKISPLTEADLRQPAASVVGGVHPSEKNNLADFIRPYTEEHYHEHAAWITQMAASARKTGNPG